MSLESYSQGGDFTEPEKAKKFVLASIALHNWLKKHNDTQTTFGRIYPPPQIILATKILMEYCTKEFGGQK